MGIGEQLKSFMRASGETGYGIAKATGVEQSAISRFLSGERGLDLTSIEKLAKHFRLELRQKPLAKKKKGR